MASVGVLPSNATAMRDSASMPWATLSTVFAADGAILFQNDAAAEYFAAPGGNRAGSAFVRHFVDRELGRRLWDKAMSGLASRIETNVHDSSGITSYRIEISPAAGQGDRAGVMLIERVTSARDPERDGMLTRTFAQAGADWFWETDKTLRITMVSNKPGMASTTFAENVVGRPIFETLPSINGLDYAAIKRAAERHEMFRDLHFSRVDSTGALHHFSVSGAPVIGPDGAFLGYRGIGRDRTYEVVAEQRAATAHARLVDAIESIPEAFFLLDRDDRLVLCNSRFREENQSIAANLAPGTPFAAVRAAAFAAGLEIPALDDIRGGSVIERKSGTRWFQLSARRTAEGGVAVVQTDITELKRHEHELAEAGQLLRAALENMDQGMLVLDEGLRLRLWNERILEIFDLPADFCYVGQHIADHIRYFRSKQGYSPDQVADAVAERIRDYSTDHTHVLSPEGFNGRVIERRRRALPGGGMVLTYLDITEVKRHEIEIAEKSTLLTATLANMDQGMLVLDRDMTLRIWNERVAELLGLPPDLLRVGMPAGDLIRYIGSRNGDSSEAVDRDIERRIDEMRQGGARLLFGGLPDDRYIERRSREMPDGGFVVTYTDVTERKKREDEIAEKSALLAATLDNMDQGLVVIDAENRARLWNNRLIDMFQMPPDVMRLGRPFAEVLRYFIESYGMSPDEVEVHLAERLRELREAPVPLLDRHRPDGRVIERRRRVMPQGGSVITYGDVTNRHRIERDLRRAKEEAEIASRTKTEFLANMSHELRTPLNAIIGFSDILMRETFGPLGSKRYAEYASDICASGQHLLGLINDVLDISKVEFNKIDLSEEPVDIHGIVDSSVRMVRDRAMAGGVSISIQIPDNLPGLSADDRRLRQVLLNLLSNAVKFTPAGGQVEVEVAADERGFRFIVTDTGIGIAHADLETALAPFGQIDSSLARRYQGTGLGLPLARSMTELHGGRLEIESTPGSGTSVTVWLPPSRIIVKRDVRADTSP
jgi:signal transduction histidine kinase